MLNVDPEEGEVVVFLEALFHCWVPRSATASRLYLVGDSRESTACFCSGMATEEDEEVVAVTSFLLLLRVVVVLLEREERCCCCSSIVIPPPGVSPGRAPVLTSALNPDRRISY